MNIIFDMDGTLVDTVKITQPAFELICPKYGFEVPDTETLINAIGYANPFFYYKIYPSKDKKLLDEFGEEVEEQETENGAIYKGNLLFSGIKELLLVLKEKGHNLYIASTGSTSHVESCLKKAEIYYLFSEIHCNEPDKEMMVEKIIKENIGHEWIMIGDKHKDANAAKYNSIQCIGAAYGYCVKDDYPMFDYIAQAPEEILSIVSNYNK